MSIGFVPTMMFIVLAVLIVFITYYLTTESSNVNSNWFSNIIGSAESTLSLYSTAILSVIFSVIIVFIATRKFTIASGAVIVIISGLFYLLMSSARGSGLNISVPSVTYPVGPHLGLGGVSIENRYPSHIGYGIQ